MQTSALNPTPNPLALGTHVKLADSAETGTIVGRADYIGDATQYQVRYVNGQGCLNIAWWPAEALEPTTDAAKQLSISARPGESAADFKARAASATTTATPHLVTPALATGERYAGIVIDPDNGQPTHHLVLLPEQPTERLSWDEAMAWAASIGAELPTRQEAALLFANAKTAFEPAWHWTSEQYAGNASLAWVQNFIGGYQYTGDKGYKGRVRAVRRFLID